MTVNNPIKFYKNAVIVLKDQPISLKGIVYINSEHLKDDSIITLIKKKSCLHFKFNEIASLIIKIPNEDRYNITYKNQVYSVYKDKQPNQQMYNSINSIFINAIS